MSRPTLGKILGALGLLALLSAPYTYFVSTGSAWLAGVKAVLGLLLIGAYFATNAPQLGQFASRRSSFFVVSTVLTCAVVLLALVAVNYVAAKKNKSIDLTAKKIFTLAPQTKSALQALKEPVKALAFLAAGDPDYESVDRLLARYHREAPRKFDYVFRDPRKSPDLAQKYQLRQGQVSVVLSRGEGDKETHTLINLASAQGVTEQDVTNALIKLNAVGEQKVYVVTGHEEWPLEPPQPQDPAALSEMKKSLFQEGYTVAPLSLLGAKEIPRDAALLVVGGGRAKWTPPEVALFQTYLAEGGRAVVFAEPLVDLGLGLVLARYGIELDPGVIADDLYAVESPYQVVTNFYGDAEMVRDLSAAQTALQFPQARGLTLLKQGVAAGTKVDPVVFTSTNAWEESTPDDEPSRSSGEKSGKIPLVVQAVRATGDAKAKRSDEMRLVVFGDSQIIVDANWRYGPNRNLVMNAYAFATNQVSKITIRPPDRDISTVDLDAPRMARIRFLATDLLPLSLLGVGLAVWLNRRSK